MSKEYRGGDYLQKPDELVAISAKAGEGRKPSGPAGIESNSRSAQYRAPEPFGLNRGALKDREIRTRIRPASKVIAGIAVSWPGLSWAS